MNLLNIRWIHTLFRSSWFPIISQAILLFVFGLIIAGGLGVDTTDMDFAMVLRNTNLIVWAYWWPMIVISAVLLGRFLCMVCPMELVSSLLSRFGLRRKVPNMLMSKGLVTVFYIARGCSKRFSNSRGWGLGVRAKSQLLCLTKQAAESAERVRQIASKIFQHG